MDLSFHVLALSRKSQEGLAVGDGLIEAIVWPRSKFTAPIKKMKTRLDGILVSLRDRSWMEPLKEHSLRASQRIADQLLKDCESQDFQLLITHTKRNCIVCNDLSAFQKDVKVFLKHDTDHGAMALSKSLKPILEHLDKMRLNDLWCSLHIFNVSWSLVECLWWGSGNKLGNL